MTAHVGVSGAWKQVASIAVGVSGAWKSVVSGWVGVGGVWKAFYAALSLPGTLNVSVLAAFPGSANAAITFASDGAYTSTDGVTNGNWFAPATGGVGAGFDIRWTVVSGTLTTGTAATWQSLSSARTYGRSRVGIGNETAVGTVEIRDASTLAVLATSTVTLEAEVT